MAVRATYTESPNVASVNPALDSRADFYSLCLSGALLSVVLAWLIRAAFTRGFRYRFCGIEWAAVLIVLAGLIGAAVAPNRRAAVTDFVTVLVPILTAIVLIQILDSQQRIKLVLYTIAALGAVNGYQCAEQFFSSNQAMIEQYEQDPAGMLAKLDIEHGSYRHMLFEHRLYSKDVRGFFLTGNSAGCFALLAGFAAVALLIDKRGERATSNRQYLRCLPAGAVAGLTIFGLALTHSKGAITAAVLCAGVFAAYVLCGRRLLARRKAILLAAVAVLAAAVTAAVCYGLWRGRLPGGKSMLVRWQYWVSAARMYIDHAVTGVGPGNFAEFFPRYKIPAAPETVRDPHNFVLSLLSQYGPLGLTGFLLAALVPLYRAIFRDQDESFMRTGGKESSFRLTAVVPAVCAAVLLITRPILLPANLKGASVAVAVSVVLSLYVAPVAVFAVAFVLLAYKDESAGFSGATRAAVWCAIAGVLVHNLIDFAIFEPGISTSFWAMISCLVAMSYSGQADGPNGAGNQILVRAARVAVVAGAAVVAAVYLVFVLIPVEKSTRLVERAKRMAQEHRSPYQVQLALAEAAEADAWNSAASYISGVFYLRQFEQQVRYETNPLLAAESSFREAIKRNNATYKSFEQLASVYTALAHHAAGSDKMAWLQKAYGAATEATERFCASANLRLELGQLAEQIGSTQVALKQYSKAVEIEDAYRRQFRQMFPGREVFSRLGQQEYQFAKEKIEELNKY
jgi:hypothetical protein